MTQDIIAAERRRLAPHIERVSGAEMRAEFQAIFNNVAGTFARGGYDVGEFRGIVGELIRDAAGTAAQQDRAADSAGVREPWATMPQDRSGRMSLPERIVTGLIATTCLAALAVMGWTLGLFGGSDANVPSPAPRTPAAVVQDADLITRGGYWSWSVAESCGMQRPAECDATLRKVNGAARQYGLRVFEDGSITPLGQ